MITVREVETKKDLKRFIRLPWRIYKGVEQWVPPLLIEEKEQFDKRRHPFYEHGEVKLFLAEKEGDLVGRIAAIVNHQHNQFYNDRVGFFGFFECIDNHEVAHALFDKAAEFLREHNMTTMRGPMNFSTNEVCGLLIKGYELPPCIMMPYNLPYYADLIHGCGFEKAKDLLAYHLPREQFSARLSSLAERLKKRTRVTLRPIVIKELREEIERIRTIYNSAWEKNWGFVPMTDAEFDHMAKKMKQIVAPRLCTLVEYEGTPVAFMLNLPDINILLKKINGRLFPFGIFGFMFGLKKMSRIRTITLGVIKEFRNKGIDLLLYHYIYSLCFDMGIMESEISWVLEDNAMMISALEQINAYHYKTYRIYDRPLV